MTLADASSRPARQGGRRQRVDLVRGHVLGDTTPKNKGASETWSRCPQLDERVRRRDRRANAAQAPCSSYFPSAPVLVT